MTSSATTTFSTAAASFRQRCCGKKTTAFLVKNHLPLGLAAATLFGFLVPWPGIEVGKTPWNTISIAGIFFITGLCLETSEMKKAATAYVAIAYGVVSILVLSPLLSLAIAQIGLQPHEFSIGLAIFMAMPTTVSSGAIMTGEAKGNVALAIFFSVVTNMLAVITIPLFLSAFITTTSGSIIDPVTLLWQLTASILVPLSIGKGLRYFDAVVRFAKKQKLRLKLFSSFLLITVPWINMSQSASLLRQADPGSIFGLIALAIVFHVGLLVCNYAACLALPLSLAERKAVVINSSQKTVNTAMSVLQFLPPAAGNIGLLSLPCIISHFCQIIIDAYVVSYWSKYVDAEPTSAPSTLPVSGGGSGGNTPLSAVGAPGALEGGGVDTTPCVAVGSLSSSPQPDDSLRKTADEAGVDKGSDTRLSVTSVPAGAAPAGVTPVSGWFGGSGQQGNGRHVRLGSIEDEEQYRENGADEPGAAVT